jgi:alkyl-hydroperoxide reductase/thiol specific antioxidant family protein
LRGHEAEFRERGARLAAVGLGDPSYARAFRDESGITFPLLVDVDRAAYRAAELRSASFRHLFRWDTFTAGRRARAAGHRQGRTGQNPFQLGGSFVFGPGNVDRYAHVNETFGDSAPVSRLLGALGR